MTEFLGIKIPANPWVVLLLIVLTTAVLAYFVNLLVLWLVKRAFRRTAIDERIYRLLDRYLYPLLIVSGLLLIADAAPLPTMARGAIHQFLVICALLLGIVLATKGALLILRNIEARYGLYNIRGPLEIVTKIVLIAVGAMIILDNLGISLTPILTTLGIGSLAVAIALQDTLGNFFAGLYVKADRPIEVGHYIKLQTGDEGYVERIGWRSTRIRMLPDNMVVVPNNKLVQDIITNYHLPTRELAVLVPVGVAYDSDLEKVEKVTQAVAREALKTVPGGVPDSEPLIRYNAFNQSSIDFTVVLRAREFTDGILLKHEFIKKLHVRYEKEGITIPFPIRTVYLKPESDGGDRVETKKEP
ncbi:MAG TPA: mechanosensitive ion channel family protein [Candidatus Binatia bacterium]